MTPFGRQCVRFALQSLGSLVGGLGLLAVLSRFLPSKAAFALSLGLMVAVNFTLHWFYVFPGSAGDWRSALRRFLLTTAGFRIGEYLWFVFWVDRFPTQVLVVGLSSYLVSFVVKFGVLSGWVFRGPPNPAVSAGSLWERPLTQSGRWTLGTFLRETAPWVVLALLCVARMPKVALGDRPVTVDHTVLYQNASILWHRLWAGQPWHGVTDQWFAGYPVNYFYPPGQSLWVVGVRALTGGLADLGTAYAWAFFGWFLLQAWVLYWVGRRLFGISVGLLAALFLIFDAGEWAMGGWRYSVVVGVWGQGLAQLFALPLILWLPALARKGDLSVGAVAALLVGMSLLTHPIMAFFFLLLFGTTALFHGVEWGRRSGPGLMRLGAVGFWGILIAAVYLFPFFALKAEGTRTGLGQPLPSVWQWFDLPGMGAQLYGGTLFKGTWAFVNVLGTVGAAVLAFSRRRESQLIGTLFFGLLLLGSNLPRQLGWDKTFTIFNHMILPRFGMLAKPLLLVSAAYAFVGCVRGAAALGGTVSSALPPPRGLRWIGGLLVLPLAFMGLRAAWDRQVAPAALQLKTASERTDMADRAALVEYLNSRFRSGEGFFRVALGGQYHELVDLAPLLEAPIHKFTFVPASEFRYKVRGGDDRVLQALSVRYGVSLRQGTLPRDRRWSLVRSFRSFDLYEYAHWSPRRVWFERDGAVPLELSFHDEQIRFRVPEGVAGRVLIAKAPFSRWRAQRNGTPIPWASEDLGSFGALMALPAAPGDYELTYRRGVPELAGAWISLLALLGLVGVLALALRRQRNQRLQVLGSPPNSGLVPDADRKAA